MADNRTLSTTGSETYTLSLKGEGITVEREVEKDVALQILAAVLGTGGGQPIAPMVAPTATGGAGRVIVKAGGGRAQSLREYLNEVEAKRNVDKILAIATYLERSNPETTITPDVIKAQFRSASEPVPGNFTRDFRWAVQNGWLASVEGAPDEYYITNTGHDAVADKFSSDVKKKTGVERTRPRRRAAKKAASGS